MCYLSSGCSFVHSTNRECIWDVLSHSAETEMFKKASVEKASGEGFMKGNVLLARTDPINFVSFRR